MTQKKRILQMEKTNFLKQTIPQSHYRLLVYSTLNESQPYFNNLCYGHLQIGNVSAQ